MTTPAQIHPEEPGAVAMLDRINQIFVLALDEMPISEVASNKAKVATIATATKQLNMSREAQEYATESVRRSEVALAWKIRRGQQDGTLAPANDISTIKRMQTIVGHEDDGELPRPTDFATRAELYGARPGTGILSIADAAPNQAALDAALDEAKAEGNLSRANVARKAREAAGTPERARPRRALPDQFFDATYDLTKVTERIDRLVSDDRFPQNAEKVGAKHRADLLRAVELLTRALDRFTSN